DLGLEARIDVEVAPLVGGESGRLQAEILDDRASAGRHQHGVRAERRAGGQREPYRAARGRPTGGHALTPAESNAERGHRPREDPRNLAVEKWEQGLAAVDEVHL